MENNSVESIELLRIDSSSYRFGVKRMDSRFFTFFFITNPTKPSKIFQKQVKAEKTTELSTLESWELGGIGTPGACHRYALWSKPNQFDL